MFAFSKARGIVEAETGIVPREKVEPKNNVTRPNVTLCHTRESHYSYMRELLLWIIISCPAFHKLFTE